MAPVASANPGWGNYVLFTREAARDEPVSIAVAGSCVEALRSLVPSAQIVTSACGVSKIVLGGGLEFEGASQWILGAIDAEGRHHIVVPTRSRRLADHAEAWGKFTEPVQRMADKIWATIDRIGTGSALAEA